MPQIPIVAIVDDDESVRVATESYLRSFGFGTSTFASAEDFLQSPRLHDSCCLITDIQMPGMSGLELQAHLLDEGNDMPVIFITAYPEERIRLQVEITGAAGFLSKPFRGGDMIECIRKALKSRHATPP